MEKLYGPTNGEERVSLYTKANVFTLYSSTRNLVPYLQPAASLTDKKTEDRDSSVLFVISVFTPC